MKRSRFSIDTDSLTVSQILLHAKQRELSARMTLRAAARLQSEADALRKEAKRRKRAQGGGDA
jgi:hypothetical protein